MLSTKNSNTSKLLILNWEQFCLPRGHLVISGHIFGCHNWMCVCYWYVLPNILCLTSYHNVFEIHPFYCMYFVCLYWWVVVHGVVIPQFFYPFTSWWTFGFQFWAIMNNVALNIQLPVLCGHTFRFFLGKYSDEKNYWITW